MANPHQDTAASPPSGESRLERSIVAPLRALIEALTVGILAVYVAILIAQIVLRYVFNASLVWSDELVRYGLVWNVMLGAALVSLRSGHIRVDILETLLPAAAQRLLHVAIEALSLAFLLVLGFF